MTIFSLSFVFGHLVVLQLVLDSKFKLCVLGVVNVLIKGEIEKLSGLCRFICVMSN
jgi:hypothetical protein